MTTMNNPTSHRSGGAKSTARRVRSFVRRHGRITPAQTRALAVHWDRFGVELPQAGNLGALFQQQAPLTLEIGFCTGDALLGAATVTPAANFLGVEVYDAGVGQLLLRAAATDLSNLRVFRADAVDVLEALAPRSLARIWIFFPDPWPKKRHHKRRLIQPPFARLLESRPSSSGVLELATDWEAYAMHMIGILDATPGLTNECGDGHFAKRPGHRRITRFEQRGRRLGHDVFDLKYVQRTS